MAKTHRELPLWLDRVMLWYEEHMAVVIWWCIVREGSNSRNSGMLHWANWDPCRILPVRSQTCQAKLNLLVHQVFYVLVYAFRFTKIMLKIIMPCSRKCYLREKHCSWICAGEYVVKTGIKDKNPCVFSCCNSRSIFQEDVKEELDWGWPRALWLYV